MEAITGPPIMVGLRRRNQWNKVEGAKEACMERGKNLTVSLMGNDDRNNCPAVCLDDTGAAVTDKVKVKPH